MDVSLEKEVKSLIGDLYDTQIIQKEKEIITNISQKQSEIDKISEEMNGKIINFAQFSVRNDNDIFSSSSSISNPIKSTRLNDPKSRKKSVPLVITPQF